MAHKPDVPCAGGCGKLLWRGPGSLPDGVRTCRECRKREPEPAASLPAELRLGQPSEGFGSRGRRLWTDMDGETLKPADRVLLEEACRIADRCDRLDAFLEGRADAWLTFQAASEDGARVQVVVDKALSEGRQQALALKAIVAELRQSRAGGEAPSKPEASRRDELAKRRDERRRAAGL